MKKSENLRIRIITLFIATLFLAGCSAGKLPCENVVQPDFVLVE